MPSYTAPIDDLRFVLYDLLGGESLSDLPDYEEATPDLIDAVLTEAGRLAENELAPLNQIGDQQGCRLENGVVRTPDGFRDAYAKFIEGGWTSLAGDPAYGGQGLPKTVQFMTEEIFSAANMAFAMYPGLSAGAYNALASYGTDFQKDLFLPKLVDGTWSGTMCLTEPQCGTDLGLIRTKAVPAGTDEATGQQAHAITGTKIFISAGEHDLADNILHLVLARLPDAPAGIKGISLFAVPKFVPKRDGDGWVAGARNAMACGALEHKMGIKGSATCVMNFDGATGYLVGQPHKGMRAMFVMMNAARLVVGLQGLGQSEVAYQNAVAYARDRVQGRSLTGTKAADKPADPIIVHPDVRRNLLTMKAFNEGARALAYWVAMAIDRSVKHPDPQIREDADDLVQLMTPIIKAYFTDMGFECANMGLQVFGGHGYIAEWGMEQFVRDARIAQIYEGANGIQALDLVGRKMGTHTGRYLRRFFHPVAAFIAEQGSDPDMRDIIRPLSAAFGQLQQITGLVAQKGMKNLDEAGAASSDYLRLFALVALGYMWARMARVALDKLPEAGERADFYRTKVKTAHFFAKRVLPETGALALKVKAGAEPLMAMAANEF